MYVLHRKQKRVSLYECALLYAASFAYEVLLTVLLFLSAKANKVNKRPKLGILLVMFKSKNGPVNAALIELGHSCLRLSGK